MTAKIIIVGTDHRLQCGVSPYTEDQIKKYENYIRELHRKYQPKFIAEEMCYYGLARNNVFETVIKKIISELLTADYSQVGHEYIDIPFEGKNLLNIGHSAHENFGGDVLSSSRTERMDNFRKTLITPVRERYWLAKLLSVSKWPCIFICGDDHVESMSNLIHELDDNIEVLRFPSGQYLGQQ
jgi:hypothetical protein